MTSESHLVCLKRGALGLAVLAALAAGSGCNRRDAAQVMPPASGSGTMTPVSPGDRSASAALPGGPASAVRP